MQRHEMYRNRIFLDVTFFTLILSNLQKFITVSPKTNNINALSQNWQHTVRMLCVPTLNKENQSSEHFNQSTHCLSNCSSTWINMSLYLGVSSQIQTLLCFIQYQVPSTEYKYKYFNRNELLLLLQENPSTSKALNTSLFSIPQDTLTYWSSLLATPLIFEK